MSFYFINLIRKLLCILILNCLFNFFYFQFVDFKSLLNFRRNFNFRKTSRFKLNMLLFRLFEVLKFRRFSLNCVFMICFFFFKNNWPFLEIFYENCWSKINGTWLRNWIMFLNFFLNHGRNLIFFLRILKIFLFKFFIIFLLIIIKNFSLLSFLSSIFIQEWTLMIRNSLIMISFTILRTFLTLVVISSRLLKAFILILKPWNNLSQRVASTSLVSFWLIISVEIMNFFLIILRFIVVAIWVIVIIISIFIVIAILIILILVIFVSLIIIVLFTLIRLPVLSFAFNFRSNFLFVSFFLIRVLFFVNRHLFRTFMVSPSSSSFLFFVTHFSSFFGFLLLNCIWNLFNGTQFFKLKLVRVLVCQPTFLTIFITFLLWMSPLNVCLVLNTVLLQRLIKSIFFEFSHLFDFAFQCHIGFLEILNVLVIHFIHINWFQQLIVVRDIFAALKIVMILYFNFLETDLFLSLILILIKETRIEILIGDWIFLIIEFLWFFLCFNHFCGNFFFFIFNWKINWIDWQIFIMANFFIRISFL